MIRERVTVGEQPTPVCLIGWKQNAVFLVNTGSVTVVVDSREDVELDGPVAGLTVGVGQTLAFPKMAPDLPLSVYAIAVGGPGELTYLLPH